MRLWGYPGQRGKDSLLHPNLVLCTLVNLVRFHHFYCKHLVIQIVQGRRRWVGRYFPLLRPAIPIHLARCLVQIPAPIGLVQEGQSNSIPFASFLGLIGFPKQSFPFSRESA